MQTAFSDPHSSSAGAQILSSADDMERPPDRSRTLDRVKAVVKIAARDLAHWEPDFGTTGWSAMRECLRTRDQLMHPKNANEVHISDQAIDVAKDAATWFLEVIIQIQTRALHRAAEARPE
jgi:hypothetical protein